MVNYQHECVVVQGDWLQRINDLYWQRGVEGGCI